MRVRVHYSWIVIVTPPSDVAVGLVKGTGETGNGTAAIGIIQAVVARVFAGGQQSLAMLRDIILDLRAGHSRRLNRRKCKGTRAQRSPHFSKAKNATGGWRFAATSLV